MMRNKIYRVPAIIFAIIVVILLVRIAVGRNDSQSAFSFTSFRNNGQVENPSSIVINPELLKYNGTGAYSYLRNNRTSHQLNSAKSQNYAYVTFMASKSYLPAFEVFLYSFISVKPNYPLVITIPLIDKHQELVTVVNQLASKYNDDLSYEIYLLPLVPSPGRERDRWRINWTKLQIWTMVAFDKLFYFDVDVIFLQNVDDAFDKFPFQQFLGTYDWGRWSPMGTQKLNGGVFLAQPSMQTFKELCIRRNYVDTYKAVEAEQGLFNHVYLEKHCCLPVFYNVQKTVQSHIPQLWHRDSVFVLHFTGEKPWLSWSSSKFRDTFVSEKEKQELRLIDHFDANDYEELHTLWKDYYFKGRRAELNQLTIFQSYEKDWNQEISPPSLSSVYRFVRLNNTASPSNRTDDINAADLYPKLTDPTFHHLVGEFGSLLAINQLKENQLPKYIGFSPSRQKEYSDGKEGASIDWTKVTFQPQTIYFWHAIPIKTNYSDFLDRRFPGVSAILTDNTQYSKTLQHNDYHYHIKLPSFITTKDIFVDFMKDASNLMVKLEKEKLEKGCKRCMKTLETVVEVYFNLWIRGKELNLVYTVDNPSWRSHSHSRLSHTSNI